MYWSGIIQIMGVRQRDQKCGSVRHPANATLIFYNVLRFVLGTLYKVLFGWYDILSQWRANASLLYDVKRDLYFLFPLGKINKKPWFETLPFNYATVHIDYENFRLGVTRGRDELTILFRCLKDLQETYYFSEVIAALDSTEATERKPIRDLTQAVDLLRPRLELINEAFSESNYSTFKDKLSSQKKAMRVLTKQFEWELNRRLYH